MKNILLEATSNTPAIRFNVSGRLLIEGRSLPENVLIFYSPLIEWVKNLKAEITRIDVNLEYFNSSSAKKLLEILRSLDANKAIKELIVNWHYESDDEDTFENGKVYEEFMTKAIFRYHEYSEAV